MDAGVAADGDTAEDGGASAAHAVESSSVSPNARLTPQAAQFASVRILIIPFSLLPGSLRNTFARAAGQIFYGLSRISRFLKLRIN
jgi:hypothetical protein